MTILAQLNQILATANAWAQEKDEHGVALRPPYKCGIIGQISKLFGTFSESSPLGLRVAVLFTGEKLRAEKEEGGVVDRRFLIVVSAGPGFVEPDDQRTTAGHQPIWTPLEELRDRLRGIEFDAATTEVGPAVSDIGIFTLPDGRPVDAYQIELVIGVQLPAPIKTEEPE